MNAPNFTICTLFEGDYHHGVAALINSLKSSDFRGTIILGHKGEPPRWADQAQCLAPNIQVRLFRLDTPVMLSNYKPHFMLRVLQEFEPDCDGTAYIDPDIVFDASWSDLLTWLGRGVSVCSDNCFPNLEMHHILRKQWLEILRQDFGWNTPDSISSTYFNAGFVSVRRLDIEFLKRWSFMMDRMHHYQVDIRAFKQHNRFHAFQVPDQDAFNAVAMTLPETICSLGPEAMGFTPGMSVMWHAVDAPKPWRSYYLPELLKNGRGVGNAHRRYWHHCTGPLQSWSKPQIWLRKALMKLTILLSRFYHAAS